MKVKGDELQAFVNEGWPSDDWYWDHDLFEEPDPTATYDTDEIGPLCYQGREPTDETTLDLAVLIRKWRKTRDHDIFSIKVKKADVPAVQEALAKFGIKIGSK